MLTYLRAHLASEGTALHAAFDEVQRPRVQIKKDRLAVGLGWLIKTGEDRRLVWHGGGTGGFSSFAGFNRDADAALVALANGRVVGPLTRLGVKALKGLSASG